MKTVSVNLYQFDELSDEAKRVARDWYREQDYPVGDWFQGIFDFAIEVGTFFGMDIDRIHFSGFWSQGDGASFTGIFRPENMRTLAELETELGDVPVRDTVTTLFKRFQAVKHPQKRRGYSACVDIVRYDGRYVHSGTLDVEDFDGVYDIDELWELRSCMRGYADWIYRMLDAEHTELCSDEVVDEELRANEFWFTADGHHSTLG